MSDTPRTDAVEPDGVPEDILRLCRDLEREVARLTAQLADMTADRDSWSKQNDDRVADCLRLGAEVDRLKAELAARFTVEEIDAYFTWWMNDGSGADDIQDAITDKDYGIAAWKARQKEEHHE